MDAVLNHNEIKNAVQKSIKNNVIDSKYVDESITFGQALVTHHFYQQNHEALLAQHALHKQQMVDEVSHTASTVTIQPNPLV